MSGEAVIFSPLMGDVALGVPVIAVATLAWQAVQAYREQLRQEAERRQREEKRQIGEWRSFQQRQQREMEQIGSRRSELERITGSLKLQTQAAPLAPHTTEAQSRGFLEASGDVAARRQRLGDVQALLSALPETLDENLNAPLLRLRSEGERLATRFGRGDAPTEGEIAAFRRLVSETIDQQLIWAEQQRHAGERLLTEGEGLLDRLLHCQALAGEGDAAGGLNRLRTELVRHLGNGSLTLGALENLSERFEQLRRQVEAALEREAALATLREALQRHLPALGYVAQATTQPGRQLWSIPGGEQVAVAVQPDLRVAFQLAHERSHDSGAALSAQEMVQLRRQEARWCNDLKQLLERLRADGFQYQVALEREIPGDAIPIVIVEEAEALLEEMVRWDEPKHRSLS